MNILFVSPMPFVPQVGGVERVTDRLCRSLLSRGYNCYYLTYPCDVADYDFPAKASVFPEKGWRSPRNVEFYHKYIDENCIDVVINEDGLYEHSRLFLNTGRQDVKRISVLHNDPLGSYRNLWQNFLSLRDDTLTEKAKRIARILLYCKVKRQMWQGICNHFSYLKQNTDKIVLLSSSFIPSISSIDPEIADLCVNIPNPNTYAEDIVVSTDGQKEKEVLFVGRLEKQKRVERILKVWKMLQSANPEWRLSIVGTGSEESNLKRLSASLGLDRAMFHGRQDPTVYYKRASIVCLVSDFEGWGMTLTEGMQMGCVPISFDSYPAARDIICSGETGELVVPYSLKMYAAKLQHLMTYDIYRQKLSKNASEYVKRFDIAAVTDKWVDLING